MSTKPATTWAIPSETRALFCPNCASILQLPDPSNVSKCWECDYTTQTQPDDEANAQYQIKKYKHEVEIDDIHADPTTRRATVDEKCTNCGYHEMTFYTQQMRSADESASVFFECAQCGFTYKQGE